VCSVAAGGLNQHGDTCSTCGQPCVYLCSITAATTSASPLPVLPLVGSTSIVTPAVSAASHVRLTIMQADVPGPPTHQLLLQAPHQSAASSAASSSHAPTLTMAQSLQQQSPPAQPAVAGVTSPTAAAHLA
jgi:hypothetical protein